MQSVIELEYNPYIPQLNIRIDGKQPPNFSRLVQYSDEDIWYWYKDILDAIYSEIRNHFVVSFTGRTQDAAIVECICRRHKFCKGFKTKTFAIADPMQIRMQKLNKYIKHTNKATYTKTIIDATFLLTPKTQEHMEDILTIDVNNLFCSVRISTIGSRAKYEESETGFLFLILDSDESVEDYVEKQQTQKPIFVISLGGIAGLYAVTDHAWYYGASNDTLFNTIFSCLLQVPLLLAFRRCIGSIQSLATDLELAKISSVEPLIIIDVDNSIELGKSTKISVTLDPPTSQPPKLIYKIVNQNVASCDGLCVFGKQEGTANLELYRIGDSKPFVVKEITVYKRNRIKSLILSDDSLLLGIGDKKRIKLDYAPTDADNAHTIAWKSSDKRVACINKSGEVTAMSEGTCRIICTAENASAQCICTVKPYLRDISLGIELEDGVLYLEPLSEITLQVTKIPSDCVDGEITVISSNYNAVNVIKNTLYVKDKGEAEITIKNSDGRISQTFKAVVAKKKVGFFKTLFRRK